MRWWSYGSMAYYDGGITSKRLWPYYMKRVVKKYIPLGSLWIFHILNPIHHCLDYYLKDLGDMSNMWRQGSREDKDWASHVAVPVR